MTMPEDFTNGVKEMIEGGAAPSSDPYDSLVPLGQRKVSEIKLNAGGGGKSEAELYAELGYSRPIAQVSNLTRKLYGFMRDGNVESHLERSAVKAAMSLHDFIFDAPCVNRGGRFEEDEGRAREWLRLIEQNPETYKDDNEDSPYKDEFAHLDALLKKWGRADAWMLQARIVEEQQGLDASKKLYPEYTVRKGEREEVLMEAAELPRPSTCFSGAGSGNTRSCGSGPTTWRWATRPTTSPR